MLCMVCIVLCVYMCVCVNICARVCVHVVCVYVCMCVCACGMCGARLCMRYEATVCGWCMQLEELRGRLESLERGAGASASPRKASPEPLPGLFDTARQADVCISYMIMLRILFGYFVFI